MSGPAEHGPPRLHNIGGPGRATIVWRGIGRGPMSDDTERIAAARGRGSWLNLRYGIGERSDLCHRDWNNAASLLALVAPGHGLAEAAAAAALVARIDAHTRALAWPAALLVARRGDTPRDGVILDHPLTTFVALARCTGNLWLRDRPARLAPLQAPTLVEPSGTPVRGVEWRLSLWFPDGIPDTLLRQAADTVRRRATR